MTDLTFELTLLLYKSSKTSKEFFTSPLHSDSNNLRTKLLSDKPKTPLITSIFTGFPRVKTFSRIESASHGPL